MLSPLKCILKCSVIIKISLFGYLILMQGGQTDICTHIHMQIFPSSATSAKASAFIARCIPGFTDPLQCQWVPWAAFCGAVVVLALWLCCIWYSWCGQRWQWLWSKHLTVFSQLCVKCYVSPYLIVWRFTFLLLLTCSDLALKEDTSKRTVFCIKVLKTKSGMWNICLLFICWGRRKFKNYSRFTLIGHNRKLLVCETEMKLN